MPNTTVMDRAFSNLPKVALDTLQAISSPATYPTGAVLYMEGQQARGVFVINAGRVKLSGGAGNGKSLIFRIAGAGEIVGLPGTLSNRPYEVTAEAIEPTQADFIRRKEFLAFLRENGDAAVRVAEMLSNIYHATCQEVRYLGFSASASGKLARFLLDSVPARSRDNGHLCARLTLTHEEIGEVIGVSRETVTRVFGNFKRENIIQVNGSSVLIKSQTALEKLVEA